MSPSRTTSPLSGARSAVPRKSIAPKMVPPALSTGSVLSLAPPPARSASPLAAPKPLITDISRAQPSLSSPLSSTSSFGQPYLDETMARTDHYAVNPHMYDTPPHSSLPDESFNLFGDFAHSTPKPSTPTLPPTPPSKSPSHTYLSGPGARRYLPDPTPIHKSDASRSSSISSSTLSASTRKGSGLNFDFLRPETKPQAQLSTAAHGNGITVSVATGPRPSQSLPLRPISQTFNTPSSLAQTPQGRVTSPPPSAPSIDLTSSFGTIPAKAPLKPSMTSSQGGLSAQDLSFFENL